MFLGFGFLLNSVVKIRRNEKVTMQNAPHRDHILSICHYLLFCSFCIFIEGHRNGLCVSYTPEIKQLQILGFYVKMNHFDAHPKVSSRAVDSKEFRMVIQHAQFEFYFIFLIRIQNAECNVRNSK